LRDTIERLDPFALYQRLTCPLLVIYAMAQPPAPPSMPWLAELHHAHHPDLNERFARFTAERPGVRIDRVESTHARILLEPGLSSAIDRFLSPPDPTVEMRCGLSARRVSSSCAWRRRPV
jgi:hypothetical protein